MISEKNILQIDFEGKKFLRGNKFYTEKKFFSWLIMLKKNLTPWCVRKKIISPEVWGKKSYPNQITHIPYQKSHGRPLIREYVGQSDCRICDNMLVSFYQNTDTSVTRTLDSSDFDVCLKDNLLH